MEQYLAESPSDKDMEGVIYRFVLAVGFICIGLIIYWGMKKTVIARTKHSSASLPQPLRGVPLILYFTTPNCIPCKTIQRPAIQKVKQTLQDGLDVIEIDASKKVKLAKEWNVMSVPTTYIIDSAGTTKFVNHGAVKAEKLLEQLNSVRLG